MINLFKIYNGSRLLALGFSLLLLAACEDSGQEGNGQPAGPTVTVAKPTVREIIEWDEYTGRFRAIESVEIKARVSGYLDRVAFEDGAIIQQGAILFQIDPRPFEATLARARAEVKSAAAVLENAIAEAERGASLLSRQTISQEDADRRVRSRRQAEAALEAVKAIERAAELDLEFATIRAPVSGRLSDTRVTTGNLIQGGSASATLLTTLVSMDPIYFEFTGSEADYLKYVRLNASGDRPSSRDASNPVRLRLMDEKEFLHEGHMSFVDNSLDFSTGTMRGRATFDNPGGLFIPGIFGRLRLLGSGAYKAIMLPDDAILSDQTQKFVWVVDDGNVARYRPVVLGGLYDGLRIIREGLSGDERVIIRGIQFAFADAPVNVNEAAAPSPERQ